MSVAKKKKKAKRAKKKLKKKRRVLVRCGPELSLFAEFLFFSLSSPLFPFPSLFFVPVSVSAKSTGVVLFLNKNNLHTTSCWAVEEIGKGKQLYLQQNHQSVPFST